ncbi:SusC/RagA family TonB-linked outer membrane protein [Flammeovirga sp. MY04]|uniref:SusC/RagA family TonB-linked outer membrane protein n=1 Tax=Flammeovirga sp. MY04 TaxID=1191459 RepID=UPI0008062378|nr:SusC/RagA family TonB-linked outer membrane protein [Flammeovirga sp. MY04]ANQ47937.1 SusC/RagA family TonB-linked outer membrane protein [Flammeovirga sp. MY04]
MNKHLLLFLSILFSVFNTLYAQDRVVTGTVVDADDNSPIPGVNVLIKGTTHGSVTNLDGKFSISVAENQTLVFSYVGYQSTEVNVANATNLNVSLNVDAEQLDEVVVTALGIERSERSLGYAVQGVSADDMADAATATGNMMNSLAGQVAGVQIAPSNGAGSSSRVVIRGTSVLSGNNQPLYVIDGVPMSNSTFKDGGDGYDGDVSSGDGLSSLNPDDIENISVLKGGSATALYGSRAINGVILITTKSGKDSKTGVDFSQSISLDVLGITPDEQKMYGQGTLGDITGDAKNATGMWGPKIMGQDSRFYYFNSGVPEADQITKQLRHYNNYQDFYRTGITSNTSVSAFASNDKSNIRLSYSNMDNQAMVETSTFKRNTFSIKGSTEILNKLTAEGRVSYSNTQGYNRLINGGGYGSTMNFLMGLPSTTSVKWLSDKHKDENGRSYGYDDRGQNIYFNLREGYNKDNLDRVNGMTSLTYKITDDLKILGRAGIDYNNYTQDVLDPWGAALNSDGRAFKRNYAEMEQNYDFLVSYNKKIGKFDVNVNAGGSKMHILRNSQDVGSSTFASPDFQNPTAGQSVLMDMSTYEKAINSLYATASVGFQGYLFLDASVRNDWSSTLPLNNNSFLYPSISGTWIFSDMDWDTPEWLTFGKIRANYAQVGSDTDPYQLAQQYQIHRFNMPGNLIYGEIGNNVIPNANLRPSIQTSTEFGIDLRMFNDRLGIDVARYKSVSVDQILPVNISQSSGYAQVMINAGEILNEGWEMALNYKILDKSNFNWTATLNAAYNYNEVVSLTEGVEFFSLNESGSIQAIPGQAYGAIVARKTLRDDNGNIVVNQEGIIQAEDTPSIIGNGVQPWMAGIRNTFTYKNLSLTVLIDGKFGGDIYSSTNSSMYSNGKHKDTVVGRDEWNKGDGHWNPGGLVTPKTDDSGNAISDENGNPIYEGFNGNVNPELFYGSAKADHFVYDASFIKLREVSINYRLPQEWMQNIFIKNVNVSASAFNVGYLWKNSENFDPEASFSTGNAQGLENSTMALPRTFTFKLNANF